MIVLRCRNGLVQPCLIESYTHTDGSVVASEMLNDDHDTMLLIIILMFTFVLMSTLAFVAIFYVRRWQRRTRFFAHARLNENVEEITNPIFDFAATDRDDIALPVTNISNSDDKVRRLLNESTAFDLNLKPFQGHFSNPLYESMYASSHKGLLEKKSDDDEEEIKHDLL